MFFGKVQASENIYKAEGERGQGSGVQAKLRSGVHMAMGGARPGEILSNLSIKMVVSKMTF